MIGSPLNYFDAQTGGKQGMFQMGAQLGALNSPAQGPTQAIRSVLERARAWTDKQNAFEYQKQLDTNRITEEANQKRMSYANGGGLVDLMEGAQAPAGYEVVPDYQIDSAQGRTLRVPKFVRQQDPVDLMLANMERERQAKLAASGGIETKPVAGKRRMPWDRNPDVEYMKQAQELLRAARELKQSQMYDQQ